MSILHVRPSEDLHVHPFWVSYMYVCLSILHVRPFWTSFMYVRCEYLICTSVLSILYARPFEYLHVRPPCVFYIYVRPEYLTCTPALCILDARPSWVFYMYSRLVFLISYMYVLSILHVRPSEYLTCTSVMSILHVRTVLSIFTCTSVMVTCISILSILDVSGDMNWRLILLGQETFTKFYSIFVLLRIRSLPFCEKQIVYIFAEWHKTLSVCVYLPVTQDVIIVCIYQ